MKSDKLSKNKDFVLSDSFLVKFSIIISLIGLIVLFYFSLNSKLDIITSSEINNYDDGEYVILKGNIYSNDVRDKVTFLKISEVILTDVIIFDSVDLEKNVGNYVEIRGVVRESNNKKQIYATSIEIKN
jgi:hypothetical protein